MKKQTRKAKKWLKKLIDKKLKLRFSYKNEKLALESIDLYKFLIKNDKECDNIAFQL